MSSNDTISIPLTKGYSAVVNAIDADLASYTWRSAKKAEDRIYAQRNETVNGKKKTIPMHKQILERVLGRTLLSSEQVDHKDRNGLNNIRSNLRLSSPAQNQQNQKRHKDNTSGYKGVRFSKDKWMARISVNGTRIYLGVFDTPELAHKAYCEAAKKYHGEFARFE